MEHRRLLWSIAIGLPGISALGGAWVGAGWIWDAANALGFAAAALLIFLHIETGAARNRPAPVAAFHARLHATWRCWRSVSSSSTSLALLADDAVTIEYWKLSAPPYMLAGIAALLLMSRYRRDRLSKTAPLRVRHAVGFRPHTRHCLDRADGLVAWHIAGSALYLDTPFKQTVFVLSLVGVPLWLIRRPALQRPLGCSAAARRRRSAAGNVLHRRGRPRDRRNVFRAAQRCYENRHSPRTFAAIAAHLRRCCSGRRLSGRQQMLDTTPAAAAVVRASRPSRSQLHHVPSQLHRRHRPGAVHRLPPDRSEVRLQIEPMFHTLCRDCHVEKHAAGKDGGRRGGLPLRRTAIPLMVGRSFDSGGRGGHAGSDTLEPSLAAHGPRQHAPTPASGRDCIAGL